MPSSEEGYLAAMKLLAVIAPGIFVNDSFAVKGGTAINLFVRNMPRYSVDIDLVYVPWQKPRAEALAEISDELAAISERIASLKLRTQLVHGKDRCNTRLYVGRNGIQVKVEVNRVFRGTVFPVERRWLMPKAREQFETNLELPALAADELYASKFVAALDRQHPRDLFDVWQLYETGGVTEAMLECFVIYLAGHNRPPHEVLFGFDKDVAEEYENAFAGMAQIECSLPLLLEARRRLRQELHERLTAAQ